MTSLRSKQNKKILSLMVTLQLQLNIAFERIKLQIYNSLST
jgi:hypothetical protein